VAIQVLTKPEGGSVYLDDSYRGSSGATLEEEPGVRGKIRCTMPGYKSGEVAVVFDGKTEVIICRMERIKRCIDNIKNPFDDCPD